MFEYIVVGIVFLLIGYSSGRNAVKVPDSSDHIIALQKQIEYYKELCLWHVEEKEKLKRGKYIK
jgi:hypothetical protein